MRTFINRIIQYRVWVLLATVIVTAALLLQLRLLHIIIDPDSTLPQNHPYIQTARLIEDTFGNKLTVVIGITAREGDIFQPDILAKVQRITQRIEDTPGVVKSSVSSLAAAKSRNIEASEDGMEITSLMETVPANTEEMATLKQALASNPMYENLLISHDGKSTQIAAEFKKNDDGFQAITNYVMAAVAPERDATVEINVSGVTIFLAQLEIFSERMGILFPLALLIIGLIHYEAFRTVQALLLPLVTAGLAVAWAMGFMGIMGEPFDVFNSSTPILILAIAAGHSVQILKRYYEEFALIKQTHAELTPQQQSEMAVLNSLSKVGPVMFVACSVAAIGFFSLMIFDIKSIRTFGVLTGLGVVSALILELTFIPALRVMLPPPGERELAREKEDSFWDRLISRFFVLAMYKRKQVYIGVSAIIVVLSLGAHWLVIDNSQKAYFYGSLTAKSDDEAINSRMAGTNPFYIVVQGKYPDAIKHPDVLKFMEGLQHFMQQDPLVGKTLSMADFIKRMNQAMNNDDPAFYTIPDDQNLIAQYLLLYSNSGDSSDFDSYVDFDYQNALVTAFTRSDSSAYIEHKIDLVNAYLENRIPPDITIKMGGGSLGGVALNQIMIKEKVLNILQIMGAVFIVSSLVFRSLLAGLLILVPLIAAVAVNFGIMGLLGIPLQIGTALVSAIAVGIGADYGIYMSYRLREELAKHNDEAIAIEKAFKSAGKAVLFVSTAVAGGFGVIMFSWGFYIHLWMGFLIGLAMLVSSITALTLFPALIFTLRPAYIFGSSTTDKNVEKMG